MTYSKLTLSAALAGTVLLASCSKLAPLGAENFTVTPSPMEAVGGQVVVNIDVRFPEKYMKRNATITLMPEIRYGVKAQAGQKASFQGEKVQGNAPVISYQLGGTQPLRNQFTYNEEMLKSDLYVRFKAQKGKKTVEMPDVCIAHGVLATSTLVGKTVGSAHTAIAADDYHYAIEMTQKAQIKYLIQQANVRSSEIKQPTVQEFLQTLRAIKADQKGYMLDNIEVSAYASPDGGLKLNTALAQQREKSSKRYLQGELKAMGLDADVESRYTAEDWEHFQELLMASNIQDKDVILRVLSMYEDPEQREQQIKNLSAGFEELAKEVLPELRRARLLVHYNIIGRSDDEIAEQFKADATKLSVEELLYGATLHEDAAAQQAYYQAAARQYSDDYRAFNNLGALALQQGKVAEAKQWLAQAATKRADAAEVNANLGMLALIEGHPVEAKDYLAKASDAKNHNELMGNLQVAAGNYAQAAEFLKGVNTNSAALAQLLNKDYAAAKQTLESVTDKDAYTAYLAAVVAARTNRQTDAVKALQEAVKLNPSLKQRASRDLEFVTLFNDSAFQSIVR